MRIGVTLVAAVALLVSNGWAAASAQHDAQATIAALQTKTTEQQAEIDALTTQAAKSSAGAEITPVPTRKVGRRPTVEPKPQHLADGLTLLYYYFFDNDGSSAGPHVAGEVKNETEEWRDMPAIKFVLLDEDGNILGAVTGHSLFQVVAPRETMPFRGDFYSDDPKRVGDWASEEVSICEEWGKTYWVAEFGREGLQLRNVKEETKAPGKLLIEGSVFNDNDTPAESVYVKAAIYDSKGRYTGEVWSTIDAPIPPHKSARFRLDQGISRIGGQDALAYAGPDYTYKLWLSQDINVRTACG